MLIDVSTGELLDKFSILCIKLDKIIDNDKLVNIRKEHDALKPFCNILLTDQSIIYEFERLLEVNLILWQVEDAIREKERLQEFDDEFISLARNVYFTNDARAEIKKSINILTDSELIEEKSYTSYKKDEHEV